MRDCTETINLTTNPDKRFKALLRRALSYEVRALSTTSAVAIDP